MAQTYFATIEPGLEAALLAEVRSLGGKRASALKGGVEFDATNTAFYSGAMHARCANRLWLRVDEFRARDAPELYNKTARIDWLRLLPPNARVEVRATVRESRLIHTGRIADSVQKALAQAIGEPAVRGQPFTVLARVVDDRCQLSLDASGELLYRRGWKEDVGGAPLRESVAACLLRVAGWEPGTPLYDPMCGSGTFVIEAAQQTAGIAAGASRDHAFHRWANFRPDLWAEVAREAASTAPSVLHFGSDLDEVAVERARHNAERAQVADRCDFRVLHVTDVVPPIERRGLVITNPPWNRRIADPEHNAIADFLAATRGRFDGWTIACVAPRTYAVPQGLSKAAAFEVGGIGVRLLLGSSAPPDSRE